MELIKWDSLKEDASINESLSTMGHNAMNALSATLDLNSYRRADKASQSIVERKRKVFNSYYSFTPDLKNKIVQWCKSTKGAVCGSKSGLNNLLHKYIDVLKIGNEKNGGFFIRLVKTMASDISSNSSYNSFTNMTLPYIIDSGDGKGYLLAITFDSNDIKEIKVYCKSEGKDSFEDLPQFRSINSVEYKKK
jgi:hypothetical protein